MTTKCRKFETRRDRGAYTKTTKSHKKRLYNTNLSLVFWSQRYEETYFYVKRDLLYYFRFSFKFLQQNLKETAFTTVFYGIQPPSQSSKDVGRFHVAASQPQVAITGQQGTLNNSRTFRKENGTQLTPLWSGLDSKIVGTSNTSFQCFLTYNVAHWRYLQLKNPNFFYFGIVA